MNLTNEQLEEMQRELLARRVTAEQEILDTEQLKKDVESRQGVIAKFTASLTSLRVENHFAENYAITMRTAKPA